MIRNGETYMPRIGHGYDVHRLVKDRKLILGGITIEHEVGLLGHSDADVLTHAIMDALLGAAALGDIGLHFPDTDSKYKGADSIELLKHVVQLLKQKNYSITNMDCTIIAQAPKLRPYINQITETIASACEIEINQVNIKATTEEGLGFTGEKSGISAHCVCIIE
jgi:2-C-methyl-D-erythritol 2,4-cyclodiphosphate synthase